MRIGEPPTPPPPPLGSLPGQAQPLASDAVAFEAWLAGDSEVSPAPASAPLRGACAYDALGMFGRSAAAGVLPGTVSFEQSAVSEKAEAVASADPTAVHPPRSGDAARAAPPSGVAPVPAVPQPLALGPESEGLPRAGDAERAAYPAGSAVLVAPQDHGLRNASMGASPVVTPLAAAVSGDDCHADPAPSAQRRLPGARAPESVPFRLTLFHDGTATGVAVFAPGFTQEERAKLRRAAEQLLGAHGFSLSGLTVNGIPAASLVRSTGGFHGARAD